MHTTRAITEPFSLPRASGTPLMRGLVRVGAPVLERALGLTALARLHRCAAGPALEEDFPARALATLNIGWHVPVEAANRIPSAGPLVVVANHPFGAVDGLVLLALVRTIRHDVRLFGNYLLERLPELAPLVIPVDPFGGAATGAHRRAMRQAIEWVARGGALVVFPAGEVSNVPAPGGALIDPAWKPGIARLLSATGAPVLPVYFEGRNSRVFELAGRLHPRLRTAMLARELLRARHRTVTPSVGSVIPPARLQAVGDARAVLDYLRARVYALRPTGAAPGPDRILPPVAPATHSGEDFAREINALPPARRLVSARHLSVHYASASEIPLTLNEIGRLRELTFRAAGEGSGQPLDLDVFDQHYWHLFVWDGAERRIVGAYRLGATDVIVPRLGVRGLYTRTLFTYGQAFLDALGPALELGRSFVRLECQREYLPLLLLWQGIGRFVARHPQYRRLFGPVSISAAYTGASRDALIDLLDSPALTSPLRPLVRARRPYQRATTSARRAVPQDPAEVHALIGDLEPDGKGLPVLLRQYLKLNAKVAGLSVDPAFAHVVDALSIVDVEAMPAGLVERYLGPRT